jgi:hypothetical protein
MLASRSRSMVRAVVVARDRQRAAMSGQDPPREAVAQRRRRDPIQAACVGRAALVDMQVEVEPMGDRHAEQPVERKLELRPRRLPEERDAAQDAAIPDHRLHDGAELRLVIDRELDRKNRDALQCDAVPPLLTQSVVVKRSQRKLALGSARRFFTSPWLQAGNLNCLCPLLDVRRNRFRKLRRVAADRFDAVF